MVLQRQMHVAFHSTTMAEHNFLEPDLNLDNHFVPPMPKDIFSADAHDPPVDFESLTGPKTWPSLKPLHLLILDLGFWSKANGDMQATCLAPSKLPPLRQLGSGAGAAGAATALLVSEGVPSEDAGFLSHVHTDRPLGRPRGPLLQQHVGLLVAAPPRLCAPRPCLSSSTAAPSR